MKPIVQIESTRDASGDSGALVSEDHPPKSEVLLLPNPEGGIPSPCIRIRWFKMLLPPEPPSGVRMEEEGFFRFHNFEIREVTEVEVVLESKFANKLMLVSDCPRKFPMRIGGSIRRHELPEMRLEEVVFVLVRLRRETTRSRVYRFVVYTIFRNPP